MCIEKSLLELNNQEDKSKIKTILRELAIIYYNTVNDSGILDLGKVKIEDISSGMHGSRLPEWEEVLYTTVGWDFIAGLLPDGSVVIAGDNTCRCDVHSWQNIKSIYAADSFLIGLKNDGSVLMTGKGTPPQVEEWMNVREIACGDTFAIGLRNDGKLLACGRKKIEKDYQTVLNWSNIKSITTKGFNAVMGLKNDGTVVTFSPVEDNPIKEIVWKDIVAISGTQRFFVGLKKDGKVIIG